MNISDDFNTLLLPWPFQVKQTGTDVSSYSKPALIYVQLSKFLSLISFEAEMLA